MANPFIHVELNTAHLPKAKAFYKKLFDWKLKDVPNKEAGGTYTMVDVGKKGVGGGMMKQKIPGGGSFWLPYILVDDIEAATKKAKKLKAKIMKDVTAIPGMGRLSIIVDPTGAMLGFWEPEE
jgi:predicted enzyme related to lactoylglutathione lyase